VDETLPPAEADASSSELLPQVYDDLRKLARGMVAGDAQQTLTATALVHEAWMRVSKDTAPLGKPPSFLRRGGAGHAAHPDQSCA
jgi:DNA-directed RNA polymerase specialized sigma24 family protein